MSAAAGGPGRAGTSAAWVGAAFAWGLLTSLAVAGCSYGSDPDRRADYVVTFSGAETEPGPAGAALLDFAASAYRAQPGSRVTVAGYADPARTPQSNQILSRIRAQLVADALVRRGVPQDHIRLAPRRAIGGDPGVESRRVDIRIEP